jgi:hypothetical protein
LSAHKSKIVYGVGSSLGLTGINTNNLENMVLALSGEYEKDISYPAVLQFPNTALTPITLNTPTFREFHTHLDNGNTKPTWFKYDALTTEANLPILVPVPAECVCDGFDCDLDAAMIFERVNALPNHRQASLKRTLHLVRTFITAVVVKYKKANPTILPSINTYMAQTSSLLNKWKKQRLHTLLPNTADTQPAHNTTPPAVAKTPSLESTGSNTKDQDWSPEAFLKSF